MSDQRLGPYLDQILSADSHSLDARKKLFTALAHHLGEEYAFLQLEGGVSSEVILPNFNSSFEDGLRCAARQHERICRKGGCEALQRLRETIRHRPKLRLEG